MYCSVEEISFNRHFSGLYNVNTPTGNICYLFVYFEYVYRKSLKETYIYMLPQWSYFIMHCPLSCAGPALKYSNIKYKNNLVVESLKLWVRVIKVVIIVIKRVVRSSRGPGTGKVRGLCPG